MQAKKLLYELKQSPSISASKEARGTQEAITTYICITISHRMESISIYYYMWMICSSLPRADLQLTN